MTSRQAWGWSASSASTPPSPRNTRGCAGGGSIACATPTLLCRPPADSYNLAGERGPADYDQRHRFNLAGVLYLPGHFTLGCVVSLSSGTPYDITTGFDDNQDTVFSDRPTLGNPAAPFQSFG